MLRELTGFYEESNITVVTTKTDYIFILKKTKGWKNVGINISGKLCQFQ